MSEKAPREKQREREREESVMDYDFKVVDDYDDINVPQLSLVNICLYS